VAAAGEDDEEWLDADAGRLVRPYAVSDGRTRPANKLDMLSMVMARVSAPTIDMGPDHALALTMCEHPVSVAEIAARLRLPAAVTKIIISDLMDSGAVITRSPSAPAAHPDPSLLQAVLDGLQKL
jgi:hypothetical protein